MTRWQKDLENRAWNSIYLANHDQPRAVSRFGNDREFRVESAKLLATFTHMLQGTPYVYQGEEIGMTNVAFDSIEDYRDVETLNIYKEVVEEKGGDPQETLKVIHAKSRDNARTPDAVECQRAGRLYQRQRRGSRSTPTIRRSTSSRHWTSRIPSFTTIRS